MSIERGFSESQDEFWKDFNAEVANLKINLNQVEENKPTFMAFISNLKEKHNKIQNYATESSRSLPAYDVRRSQEILDDLGRDIKQAELKYGTKKKFNFSSRSKNKETQQSNTIRPPQPHQEPNLPKNHAVQDPLEKPVRPPLSGSYTISDRSHQSILLNHADLYGSSSSDPSILVQLLIKDVFHSTISIPTCLGSVRLENVSHCKISLGPCNTSVYLQSVEHTDMQICCHQLRIHESNHCRLFVRVHSHPIIEDCDDMGFGRYSFSYPLILDDLKRTNLEDADCWNNVVDFKWHKTIASPHWHIIGEDPREIKQESQIGSSLMLGKSDQAKTGVLAETIEEIVGVVNKDDNDDDEEEEI